MVLIESIHVGTGVATSEYRIYFTDNAMPKVNAFGSINYIEQGSWFPFSRLEKGGQVICCDFSVVLDTLYKQCVQGISFKLSAGKTHDAFRWPSITASFWRNWQSSFWYFNKANSTSFNAWLVFLQRHNPFQYVRSLDSILNKLVETYPGSSFFEGNHYWNVTNCWRLWLWSKGWSNLRVLKKFILRIGCQF